MRRIIALLSALLALCLLAGTAYAQAPSPSIPPEVEELAKQGLEMFKIKAGPKATLFGFADSEEVSQVTLGPGHQLHYLLDADKLRNASGDSLLDLVTPAQSWLYTVNVDGVSKGSLIIAFSEGRYQMVDFGGFRPDYGIALGNWHRLVSEKGASVEPVLIQWGIDYFFAAKVGTQEFVLTTESPARAQNGFAGGMDYTRLRPAADIVRHLQKQQQEAARRQPGSGGGSSAVGGTSGPNRVGASDMGGSNIGDAGSPDVGPKATDSSSRLQVWVGVLGLLAAGAAVIGALAWHRRASPKLQAK